MQSFYETFYSTVILKKHPVTARNTAHCHRHVVILRVPDYYQGPGFTGIKLKPG